MSQYYDRYSNNLLDNTEVIKQINEFLVDNRHDVYRLKTYGNVVENIVDLFCLSYCDFLIKSNKSTWSEFAEEYRHQPALDADKGLDKIEKYIQNGSKGNLDLTPYYINSIGNLKTVGGDLDIVSSDIKSLGDLESVDGYLNLYDTKIDSFGKLKYVGKGLYINSTPLSKKYSEDEIRQMINVGGEIEM